MTGNILFLGNKIFEIPPFFQTRPGDLGKKGHACSLRFSVLNTESYDGRKGVELHADHIWPIIPAASIRPYKGRKSRSQSSSALSDVTSPVKLVGKICLRRLANPKWRRQAKNPTSAKILEEMKKSVGNRLRFFNQRLPSNT